MPQIISRGQFVSQARLTLTTAVPVLSSDVSGAGTIYLTPYQGNLGSVWSGSEWVSYACSEMSQALSDTSKSPAAAAQDSVYDLFRWNDAGTLRISRGPAWSSAASRGTGAGTTELEAIGGWWVNKVAITNGPTARMGTYVGTIATLPGAATVSMHFLPAAASGGSDNFLGVWNALNRRKVVSVLRESTDSWSYTTNAWRQMNGSTANQITFVAGLAEGGFLAETRQSSNNSSPSVLRLVGIGLDAVNAPAAGFLNGRADANAGGRVSQTSRLALLHSLGRHYVAPLEISDATGTTTWIGDGGGASAIQCGMTLEMDM